MAGNQKIKVAILFGGKSAEHEVSLQSAKNVINSLDRSKYEAVLIGIDKNGRWMLQDEARYLLNSENPKLISLNSSAKPIAITPADKNGQLVTISDQYNIGKIDVIFPVVHGPNIEDGTIQGLLKLLNIPFVGPSILGSAITMDKDVAKRLLRDSGLPVPDFLVFQYYEKDNINFNAIVKKLGLPFFCKPPTLGSSVGVSKVKNKEDFKKAVDTVFQYDTKILFEEFIDGREIECGILGNDNPKASVLGEVIPTHEFYDYEAKYIDEQGASIEIPAKLPQKLTKQIQELAIKTFKTLCCEGFSRVDFFVNKQNKPFINEINPIPGFTNISMYPKLWEASGLNYSDLIDRLIELAILRYDKQNLLKTSFN